MNFDVLTLQRNGLLDPRSQPAAIGVMNIKPIAVHLLEKIDKEFTSLELILKTQQHCKTLGIEQLDKVVNWELDAKVIVTIPAQHKHPFNEIILEFVLLGKERRTWSKIHLHLHDVVKASPISLALDINGPFGRIGKLDAEITFNYGVFGYGNSCMLFHKPNTMFSLYPDFKNTKPEQFDYPDYIPSLKITEVNREGKQSYIPDHTTDLNQTLIDYFSESKRLARVITLKKQLFNSTPNSTITFLKDIEASNYQLNVSQMKRS